MKVILTGSRYGLVLYCPTCGCALEDENDNARTLVSVHPQPRKGTFWHSAVPKCKYAGTKWKAPVVELQEAK